VKIYSVGNQRKRKRFFFRETFSPRSCEFDWDVAFILVAIPTNTTQVRFQHAELVLKRSQLQELRTGSLAQQATERQTIVDQLRHTLYQRQQERLTKRMRRNPIHVKEGNSSIITTTSNTFPSSALVDLWKEQMVDDSNGGMNSNLDMTPIPMVTTPTIHRWIQGVQQASFRLEQEIRDIQTTIQGEITKLKRTEDGDRTFRESMAPVVTTDIETNVSCIVNDNVVVGNEEKIMDDDGTSTISTIIVADVIPTSDNDEMEVVVVSSEENKDSSLHLGIATGSSIDHQQEIVPTL
jgi:hypothetical protein